MAAANSVAKNLRTTDNHRSICIHWTNHCHDLANRTHHRSRIKWCRKGYGLKSKHKADNQEIKDLQVQLEEKQTILDKLTGKAAATTNTELEAATAVSQGKQTTLDKLAIEATTATMELKTATVVATTAKDNQQNKKRKSSNAPRSRSSPNCTEYSWGLIFTSSMKKSLDWNLRQPQSKQTDGSDPPHLIQPPVLLLKSRTQSFPQIQSKQQQRSRCHKSYGRSRYEYHTTRLSWYQTVLPE